MLKKIWQIIFLVLIASIVFWWQFSFVSGLPAFWSNLNLPLIMIVFALFFYDWRLATTTALVCGLWSDLMSFSVWGLNLITLLLTVAVAKLILTRLLTNRSLYSFVLLIILAGLAAALTKEILLLIISDNHSSFFLIRSHFWQNLGYESLWSLLFSLLMFNGAGFMSRRLQPFFLEKR